MTRPATPTPTPTPSSVPASAPVTFRQARRIVGAALAPSWPDDLAFLVLDAPAYLVDKTTGVLTEAVASSPWTAWCA